MQVQRILDKFRVATGSTGPNLASGSTVSTLPLAFKHADEEAWNGLQGKSSAVKRKVFIFT